MRKINSIFGVSMNQLSKIGNISTDRIQSLVIEAQQPLYGSLGIFGGGSGYGGGLDIIHRIDIDTLGNSSEFGVLAVDSSSLASTSNGLNSRGVFAGGTSDDGVLNTMEYITISTPSNSSFFGNLSNDKTGMASTSNGTSNRGVLMGGWATGSATISAIEYITISNAGNSTVFGNLTDSCESGAGLSNNTNNRGVFGGGYSSTKVAVTNTMEYITISTTGDASVFGDLTEGRERINGISNGINDRGLFISGVDQDEWVAFNVIDYITISTTGNAVYFGDLRLLYSFNASLSNGVGNRGVVKYGYDMGESLFDTMDYIDISTLGNSSYFGDAYASMDLAATSNA